MGMETLPALLPEAAETPFTGIIRKIRKFGANSHDIQSWHRLQIRRGRRHDYPRTKYFVGRSAGGSLGSSAGCGTIVLGPNFGLLGYPIPLSPYFQKREEDAA